MLHILRMDESDSSSAYYHVPDEWWEWKKKPFGTPQPHSLTASQIAEFGDPINDEFSWRSNQDIAADDNYIGSGLTNVAKFIAGRDFDEMEGTFY